MIADVADYSEWKTSRRAIGFMYAGILFALKFGLGAGGYLSAKVIMPTATSQRSAKTEHALLGIRLGGHIYPAIMLVIVLILSGRSTPSKNR